ncbi:hypothetical protein [Enterovibrio norvegicus]|uniref:hypothetical protein n=1 Tax=Enterovibrio norvegicus TaxID=188144 RepID=UPI000C81DB69|nr:hypothetical protein [Enterovibrio norvegicus]PML76131.1 hypothetical protein BCT69_05655 [Enterovibrio norvegicus]
MSISKLFNKLNAPLKNVRWSWGAVDEKGRVVLRTWEKERRNINGVECVYIGGACLYKGHKDSNDQRLGAKERLGHIELIRRGSVAGFVECKTENLFDEKWTISSFEDKTILLGSGLIETEQGQLFVPIRSKKTVSDFANGQ